MAAAERAQKPVGIDIAFRWLIIARKRLEEAKLSAQLICCCAEFLPFRAETFSLVVAENLLEHTAQPQLCIEEAHRVLKPNGVFFASTWNRLALAPEPHVRLWGVGWLPREMGMALRCPSSGARTRGAHRDSKRAPAQMSRRGEDRTAT